MGDPKFKIKLQLLFEEKSKKRKEERELRENKSLLLVY